MEIYFISDVVGILGVGFILLAFLLLQLDKVTSSSMFYLLLNAVGALLLLFSLYYHWNLASVIIEFFWFFISCYGILRVKFFVKNKSDEKV